MIRTFTLSTFVIAILASAGCDIGGRESESPGCKCACDSEDTDLEPMQAKAEKLYAGTYTGIVRSPSLGDASVNENVACTEAGQDFTLTVKTTGEMSCTGSEDEQDISCTHAAYGGKAIEGNLVVTGTADRKIGGRLGVRSCSQGKSVEFELEVAEPVAPLEGLNPSNELSQLGDDFDSLFWDKRLTAENDQPAIWERCELQIATHTH